MNDEIIENKISEKNNAKKKYLTKLELVKQHYGVEFKVENFENNEIDKIKFYNMNYKNSIRNVSIIYDGKSSTFNYIAYDYDLENDLKRLRNNKILEDLKKEKKLKLVVEEVKRINREYQLELENIDNKYNNLKEETNQNVKELEYIKNVKKSDK